MKSHYCGEITSSNLKEKVTICGWIHRRRDHGGVIFLDVRDIKGICQAVVNPDNKESFQLAESIRNEFVVQIEGVVRNRLDGTINKNMKTGEIEEVLALVREFAAQDATIIHGVAFDDSMGADIKVTIVATGLGGSASKKMPKNTFEFESVEPILPKPDISHSSREVKKVSSSDLMDSEYLDIPSFVKKQID